MRLRCSTGLRPVEFFGSFIMNNTTDVELASIDADKVLVMTFFYDIIFLFSFEQFRISYNSS